jgi:hypothetical protein
MPPLLGDWMHQLGPWCRRDFVAQAQVQQWIMPTPERIRPYVSGHRVLACAPSSAVAGGRDTQNPRGAPCVAQVARVAVIPA